MAQEHDHHHGDGASEYFVEQMLTILVCGALGLVAVRMYQTDMLRFVLAPQFHLPVLVGGVAVLVLVTVRAVAVWREAGEARACNHDHHHDHAHSHGHEHTHDHHHHAHAHGHTHAHDDHGHSHDLSWTFARLLVLVFPVALFLLDVPSAGFSQDYIKKQLGTDASIGPVDFGGPAAKGDGTAMKFGDLNDAAFDPDKRKNLQGDVAVLKGRFQRIGDKEFTLFKLKMTCCASDTVPLKVRIVTRQSLSGFNDFDWVQVKGRIDFLQAPGSTRYVPVVKVADLTDIVRVPAENEYE